MVSLESCFHRGFNFHFCYLLIMSSSLYVLPVCFLIFNCGSILTPFVPQTFSITDGVNNNNLITLFSRDSTDLCCPVVEIDACFSSKKTKTSHASARKCSSSSARQTGAATSAKGSSTYISSSGMSANAKISASSDPSGSGGSGSESQPRKSTTGAPHSLLTIIPSSQTQQSRTAGVSRKQSSNSKHVTSPQDTHKSSYSSSSSRRR